MRLDTLTIELPFEQKHLLVCAYSTHDHLVGTICIQYEHLTVASFSRLFVHESYRMKGIGRMLIDKAKRWAAANGCEGLSCSVNPHNAESIDFYKHLGFKIGYQFQDGDLLMHLPIEKEAA